MSDTSVIRARVELARAQLVSQLGHDDDFERLLAAQEAAQREDRAEKKRQLAALEQQIEQLNRNAPEA